MIIVIFLVQPNIDFLLFKKAREMFAWFISSWRISLFENLLYEWETI